MRFSGRKAVEGLLPHGVHREAAGLPALTVMRPLAFPGYCRAVDRGAGTGNMTMPQSLPTLLRLGCFSSVKTPRIAASLWLISQS